MKSYDIKTRRLQLGMSLQDVATKVGVTKSTIKRWEDSDIDMKRDKIERLSKALQIPPILLIEGIDANSIPFYSKVLKKALEISLDKNYVTMENVNKVLSSKELDLIWKNYLYVDHEKVMVLNGMTLNYSIESINNLEDILINKKESIHYNYYKYLLENLTDDDFKSEDAFIEKFVSTKISWNIESDIDDAFQNNLYQIIDAVYDDKEALKKLYDELLDYAKFLMTKTN